MNLIKLNNLLHELDNKYDINSGYCTLVASIIAKYCEIYHIKYTTKVYYYYLDQDCPWHWSIIIDNIEINPSTYKYEKWEKEVYRIENYWNSQNLLEQYNKIISDNNYFKKYKEELIRDTINNFLINSDND